MNKFTMGDLLDNEYLVDAVVMKSLGFNIDLFANYLVGEIDKIDEQIDKLREKPMDNATEIVHLSYRKDTLEEIRRAYHVLKK